MRKNSKQVHVFNIVNKTSHLELTISFEIERKIDPIFNVTQLVLYSVRIIYNYCRQVGSCGIRRRSRYGGKSLVALTSKYGRNYERFTCFLYDF